MAIGTLTIDARQLMPRAIDALKIDAKAIGAVAIGANAIDAMGNWRQCN